MSRVIIIVYLSHELLAYTQNNARDSECVCEHAPLVITHKREQLSIVYKYCIELLSILKSPCRNESIYTFLIGKHHKRHRNEKRLPKTRSDMSLIYLCSRIYCRNSWVFQKKSIITSAFGILPKLYLFGRNCAIWTRSQKYWVRVSVSMLLLASFLFQRGVQYGAIEDT